MSKGDADWWRGRPRSRRTGAVAFSAFGTAFPAFTVLAVTTIVVFAFQGMVGRRVPAALTHLGRAVERDVLALDGIVLGVLASLLIAQVIAREPRLQTAQEARRYGSVALFAHVLAGLPIAAAVLAVWGAVGDQERSYRLWVILVIATVGIGAAQWIEWYWARNRRLVRNRARTETIVNAWEIHRSSAVLATRSGARRAPVRKLVLHLVLVCSAAALSGSVAVGTIALIVSHELLHLADAAGYLLSFFVSEAWVVPLLVLTAGLQASVITAKDRPWGIGATMVLMIAVGLPAAFALLVTDWTAPGQAARTVGMLTATALPFVVVLAPSRSAVALAPRMIAVSLRISRCWRIQLLRDVYASEWKRSPAARGRHVRRTSLERNRPERGVGSAEWLRTHDRGRTTIPPRAAHEPAAIAQRSTVNEVP
jgi:hypothetical protein